MSPSPAPPKESPKRGSALIMVVFTLFLVMLVVSAVYMMARRNLLAVNEDYWRDKAEYAARAGIEHTIAYLTANPTFGSMALATIPLTEMAGEPDLTYTVEVLNHTAPPTDPETFITSPDGMEIPSGVCWVRSTGNLRDRVDTKSTSIVRLVGAQRPILKHAIFGMDNITVKQNSTIQGWDSSLDPMPAIASLPAQIVNRGDIGTNSTLAGAVQVNNSSTVKGQGRAGVGTPPSALDTVVARDAGAITGLVAISDEATQIPRFVIDSSLAESPYKFRLLHGKGFTAVGEDDTLNYYHKQLITEAVDAAQTPVSEIRRSGPSGSSTPSGTRDPADEFVNYYMPPATPTTEQAAASAQMAFRPYFPIGGYDLTNFATNPPAPATNPDSLTLEDVMLRRGIYYIKGDLILKGKINIDPAVADFTGAAVPNVGLPCLMYVDGDVTIEPGAKINWDGGYDGTQNIDFKGGTDEPLQPRLLQIYSVIDPNDPSPSNHTVTIGDNAGPRTYASFVACGSNMDLKMYETDYYGGAQCRAIDVLKNSNAYFDIDVYGKPLEGRGELAILVSTVSVYRSTVIAAAGPAPAPAPVPVGPGPSSPAIYTTTYNTGYCAPMIPIPYNACAY